MLYLPRDGSQHAVSSNERVFAFRRRSGLGGAVERHREMLFRDSAHMLTAAFHRLRRRSGATASAVERYNVVRRDLLCPFRVYPRVPPFRYLSNGAFGTKTTRICATVGRCVLSNGCHGRRNLVPGHLFTQPPGVWHLHRIPARCLDLCSHVTWLLGV